jgi:hypothetical protein
MGAGGASGSESIVDPPGVSVTAGSGSGAGEGQTDGSGAVDGETEGSGDAVGVSDGLADGLVDGEGLGSREGSVAGLFGWSGRRGPGLCPGPRCLRERILIDMGNS